MTLGAQEKVPGLLFDYGGAVYNVKHLDFDAAGDGSENDTGAIQAAIDLASADGGGIVWLPQGTYMCTQLKLGTKVILQGAGWDSVIKQVASTALDLITLTATDTEQSGMRDLSLDGDKASQSAANNGIELDHSGSPTLELNGPAHTFYNLLITNCKGFGIRTQNDAKQILFDRIYVKDSDLNNFEMIGSENFLRSCVSVGSGGSGFTLKGDRTRVVSCLAQDNDDDGFHINDATHCIISACTADKNGVDAGNANAAGFHIQRAAGTGGQENVITGCIASNSSGSTQNYSLRFSGSTTTGNRIDLISKSPASGDITGTEEGNVIHIDQKKLFGGDDLTQGFMHSHYGTDGSSVNDHFKAGKAGSPASGNPEYLTRTSAAAVAIYTILSDDGTTERVFLTLDHAGALLTLGTGGTSGVVNVLIPVFTTAQLPAAGTEGRIAFDSTLGTFVYDDGANWISVEASSGVASLTAQNGVTNTGTASDPIVEADSTVVRTTGTQSIAGVKTFTNEIICTADITAFSTSDERLKCDLRPIENVLEIFKYLRCVTHDWIDPSKGDRRASLIAQDVQQRIPEAVIQREDGYLALQYEQMIPYLVASVKALTERIEDLEHD